MHKQITEQQPQGGRDQRSARNQHPPLSQQAQQRFCHKARPQLRQRLPPPTEPVPPRRCLQPDGRSRSRRRFNQPERHLKSIMIQTQIRKGIGLVANAVLLPVSIQHFVIAVMKLTRPLQQLRKQTQHFRQSTKSGKRNFQQPPANPRRLPHHRICHHSRTVAERSVP